MRDGIPVAAGRAEVLMANEDNVEDMTVVPLPGEESEEEHARIRSSNDRDQQLEREGKVSRHNRGYDEAADGKTPEPEIERVVDED
jgi:hypothetical protein